MKDLIVVVADSYQEKVIETVLQRVPLSLGIRKFDFDIFKNPSHDSGCFNESHELIRPFINQYHYSLIMFDFEGCGVEHLSVDEIEKQVMSKLENNGWKDRNLAIVIKPELENWMWIEIRHVENAIAWEKNESLYSWARINGYLQHGKNKPNRPKEIFELALRISETSKSAAIYKNIAAKVSLKNCEDIAFRKLIDKLQDWFRSVEV